MTMQEAQLKCTLSFTLVFVPDLTLNSFLQSFRRFCNTYRVPKFIYTDNAQYFIASRNYLEKALLENEFDYPKLNERVSLVKPFLHTGIDYTSHIFVNDDAGSSVKMYIVLYTCLGSRSHIEFLFAVISTLL